MLCASHFFFFIFSCARFGKLKEFLFGPESEVKFIKPFGVAVKNRRMFVTDINGVHYYDFENGILMIESYHELFLIDSNNLPVQLSMKRRLYKKAGEDYILFRVEFTNKGKLPVQYNYLFGDEPWVGDFGNSDGDIGWSDRGGI